MYQVALKPGRWAWAILALLLMCSLGSGLGAQEPAASEKFDLLAFRQLAASNRAEGIRVGRDVLARGLLVDQPRQQMRLLWYMGGAAIGAPDAVALAEVVQRLDALESSGNRGAGSLADFLRGAQQIDGDDPGAGLITVLTAANAIPDDDTELRTIAAAELCRAYAGLDEPGRGIEHCQRHTRLVRMQGDPIALARAQYLEASVLSTAKKSAEAVPLWRSARDGFAAAGLDALAGRAAGGLAYTLIETGSYPEALEAARASVAAAQASGNPISIPIAQVQLADALLHLQRVRDAGQVVDDALRRMQGIEHPETLRQLKELQLKVLRASAASQAQVETVAAEVERLTVKMPAREHAGAIDQLELRYVQREQALRIRELEQEGKRHELDAQAAQQRTIELEQRTLRQRTYLMLGGAAVLVLAVFVVAGIAVLRAQRKLADNLRDQAYRDALTKLPNRRALVERLQALCSNAEGVGKNALLLVDIDHFKRVNDTHGHLVGDRLLAQLAGVLVARDVPDGMTARLGGEEFVILAPGLGLEAAMVLAEHLRQAVSALELRLDDGTALRVTVSIGLAMQKTADKDEYNHWLGAADAALYRAKEGGRNRVVVDEGASS